MAIRPISTLKSYFVRGAKPTAAQFADLIDSFFHKQSTIGQSSVENLTQDLTDLSDAIDEKQDILTPGSNIKIENNEISSELTYPVIEDVITTDVVVTMHPNTEYRWGTINSLSVTLGELISGRSNEFFGQFTTGATVGNISFPASVTWSGGEPTFNASKIYQFSIVNNIGLVVEI